MGNKFFCPSMMCANILNLKGEIERLNNAGVDVFHLDIMDGNFVPNFALGAQDVKAVRASTDKLMDVHLMISDPCKYVDLFSDLGADIIYIHPEADLHPLSTLSRIKANKKKCGLAIDPETSISSVKNLLGMVDYLLVMTVSPGFAGQRYLNFVTEKIKEIVRIQSDYSFKIVADGAISPEKISELGRIGVEGFVLGTATLFGKEQSYREIIEHVKNL